MPIHKRPPRVRPPDAGTTCFYAECYQCGVTVVAANGGYWDAALVANDEAREWVLHEHQPGSIKQPAGTDVLRINGP